MNTLWKKAAVGASFCAVALFSLGAYWKSEGGKARIHHQKIYTIADESERLLKDAEELSYEVTDHTGTLSVGAVVQSTSRQFHLSQLEAIKEDVNELGRRFARLEALEPHEPSWVVSTVSVSKPMLKQLAATTDEAIKFVNENSEKLHMQEYKDLTKALYDQSTSLWKNLHDSVRLVDLQRKMETLNKDLGKNVR